QEYTIRYQRRFKWLPSTLFDIKKLKRDLLEDAKALINVLQDCGGWNSQTDEKLAGLIKLLTKTHPQDKVLIFTQFADTVRYLTDNLQSNNITNVAGVTGQSKDPTVMTGRFSPVSNGKREQISSSDELRVLIATDVLSE
ncbi:MAG: helicase-related protein, partial [Nostoc sp.]